MKRSGVVAVVLCWNDADAVIALLANLASIDPAPALAIVVDNGSAGGTLARVKAACPDVETIPLEQNFGYAAGVNHGIRAALGQGAEWLWLLNSDIALPRAALADLLAAAQRSARCGMAGALLVDADGAVQARGGGTVNLRTGSSRHVLCADQAPDYLSGACLLLRAAMLREIGLFDERYFFYWEDVDLAYRARAAGWTMAVADRCRVEHREGSSLGRWSERRWFLLFRGLSRFLFSQAPFPRSALALRLLGHSAAMLRHGRPAALRGAWLAILPGDGDGGRAKPPSSTQATRRGA